MALDFKKKLALRAISAGMPLPESRLDKITELIHLKQLINLLGINCVLDVGANEGQFALELRGIGFKGLIVSFEPLHGAFQRLQQTFSRDSCWKGFQVALGAKCERKNKCNTSSDGDELPPARDLQMAQSANRGHPRETP